MGDLILTTFDWVPEMPRGYVRDVRVRWALEEAGLPYRVESVPFRARNAEHFSHQPFGQVPWLTDGDISIFESGAILLHLGERSDALMPSDPRGRAEAKEWLFAALNSVEAASLPWSIFAFSGDSAETPGRKHLEEFFKAQAHGGGLGRTRMAGRELLGSRHPDGGCAAPCRSVRRAGGTSRLSGLCRARHRPFVLCEGARRPAGAFCRGRLNNSGANVGAVVGRNKGEQR
jgi:glutathione S-transferase